MCCCCQPRIRPRPGQLKEKEEIIDNVLTLQQAPLLLNTPQLHLLLISIEELAQVTGRKLKHREVKLLAQSYTASKKP